MRENVPQIGILLNQNRLVFQQPAKEFRHLLLAQPDRFMVKPNVKRSCRNRTTASSGVVILMPRKNR